MGFAKEREKVRRRHENTGRLTETSAAKIAEVELRTQVTSLCVEGVGVGKSRLKMTDGICYAPLPSPGKKNFTG